MNLLDIHSCDEMSIYYFIYVCCLVRQEAELQFRGQRIWAAAMEDLMLKGMHFANQALLSGCSAGGLATIIHCDEFRGLFPRTTKVKCLSDAGLFLDS